MRIATKLSRAIQVAILTALLGGVAVAEDRTDWRPGWSMGRMGQGWHYGPMMGWGPEAMLDRIDGRLAFLKTELQITEAQAAVWDAMAVAVRANAEAHNALMQNMMQQMHDNYESKPLPERLSLQQTHLEARLEQVKAVRSAVEELYAALDDKQKKIADEIVLPTTGMGHGMGMMGFGPQMMMR